VSSSCYDPGQGFIGSTTSRSVVTTSFRGEVIVDVEGADSHHRLAFTADIKDGKQAPLDQRLWVEGNLSVDYGGSLGDGESEPFGLVFDPHEMVHALKIPIESVALELNSICGDYAAPVPFEAGCFPFAQHFVTTNMPVAIGLRNADDLEQAAAGFSTQSV